MLRFYSLLLLAILANRSLAQTSWDGAIFPPEHETIIDTTSGAKIIFITNHPATDNNFYFHDRCWLADESLLLFNSDRTGRSEIWGYLIQTGELVRLNRPDAAPAGRAVAAKSGNQVYVVENGAVWCWKIVIETTPKTRVNISGRKICSLPKIETYLGGLTENADGTWLALAYRNPAGRSIVQIINPANGATEIVTDVPYPIEHLQFSWSRPNLLAFARHYGSDRAPLDPNAEPHARFWFLNLESKTPIPAFFQQPGELVTHECWWVNDQMTFCGGHRPEEAHLKVLNFLTGETRVIGPGAWWPGGTSRDRAKVNWWHASGSPDGKWAAGDNWHGDVVLFNAKTCQMKIFTENHRTYGSGAHPHVGWDLTGKRIQFGTNRRGNPDVCIGILPENW